MEEKVKKLKGWIDSFIGDFKNIRVTGINSFIKRWKYQLIIILAMLLITITVPVSFTNNETINDVIYKFEKSIESNNSKELSKYLLVDNKKVDAKRLLPLIRYYKENKNSLINIINGLKKEQKSGRFNVKEEKGIIKERYYINVDSLTIKFSIPTDDTKILLEGNELLANKPQKNIIPGRYSLSYSINTEHGNVSDEYYLDIFEDKEIDINADIAYITLYSNFSDAKVFINDKELKKKSGEIYNYGPIPTNKNLELYIKRDFPWGTISSDKVKITKDEYIKLDINMINDNLMNDVKESINGFYNSTFDALNNKDKSLISDCDEKVKNKIFNYIEEKSFILKNNYQITDLNVEIEKSEFKYENELYIGSIYTNINYNVYKKIMPFIKTGYDSKFLLSVKYVDGKWVIEDIQKFDE